MKVILLNSLLILGFSIITTTICWHDNDVMRRENESMKQALFIMSQQQEQNAAEIRQIKTNTETALRIVITGDFIEVKE